MEGSRNADRLRAEAFGLAADDYHRYRPRYPHSLISELVADKTAALDVGAGTGIAAAQLQDAGMEVLAVEPDARMARVATQHGISVEKSRFEDWDPAGRSFDLVIFAQSFQWVEPQVALDKVASVLRPGGRLALLWNRIIPITPTQDELDEAYAPHVNTSQRATISDVCERELMEMIRSCGYEVQQRGLAEALHYSTDAWVNMVFTYSNVLTLGSKTRSEVRARLVRRIGVDGVDAENHAVAVIAISAAN
ncbi:SAM-dependent methyltransferase [Mycolicibacterium agri]|uniref:SAM-dependent methyltransferase n=1 Tax=Mycolicibacterium agri TaxID=36811 RepID=A0A2A7N712_MYCAG|nr:class I SAM-dependent methyltransferase [Mycolicibacterium agri]PEG39563.1 SAM-dependent methyltransferase [Mycolicibacterium agri]GFG48596.1 hypothetical protein MAGR_00370 [Mycolicibacterium agri]